MKYVSISGIFEECVAKVSDELLPQLQGYNPQITGVHFRHGRWLEIHQTLKQLSEGRTTPTTKWPMVALFRDFQEQRGQRDIYSTPRMTLVIATSNPNPNMKSDKREEQSFEPILYPIYFELLKQLYLHPNIISLDPTLIPHTVIDHYYYSSVDGDGNDPGVNIFNEFTDSIEIRDLELNIKPLNC